MKKGIKRSKYLRLNKHDVIKSLIVSVLSGILNGIYTINSDMSNQYILRYILISGLSAGAGYLLKNLFTDTDGRIQIVPKQKKIRNLMY